MIAHTDSTFVRPSVPIDPWRPNLKTQINDFGMRSISHLGGTLSNLLGSRSKDQFGILTYHRVAPHTTGVSAPPYNVTPDRFREQLSGLLRRGFQFIPLRRAIVSHANGDPLPPRSVVVTFDDCFESVFTEAWPILKELQVPATLFLSTAYLDSDQPFPFDTWAEEFLDRVPSTHYRPIRTEQCREMATSELVELGSHTHTHADFRQHLQAFIEEMHCSTEILRSRFDVDRPPFAFPYGSVANGYASRDLTEAARASGVACALTTEVKLIDLRSDPFGWGRLNVFEWDTSFTLSGKLSGWYDWAPRWKHQLAGSLKKNRTPS
jgi:peptidoglycan/xylan/chitin deacetylase (PgdA/CDA1 family)